MPDETIKLKPYRAFPSLPQIGADPTSHTVALLEVKEAIEFHERRRGDPLDSFVRLRELIDVGVLAQLGQVVVRANDTVFGGSVETEFVQDTIGTILSDTSSINFTYDDGTPIISAIVIPGGVDHDLLANYAANEHVDHTAVTLTAGAGLTGGGDISASRTFDVGAGTGITVNANDVALSASVLASLALADSAVQPGDEIPDADLTANVALLDRNPQTFTGANIFSAGFRLPHGAAPGAPVNGDLWTTTAGLFGRINGTTVGPYTATGSSVPTTVQGDILYASATNVLTALAKDANATRYLSNTGASNNPAWAQVNLANGVTGDLPFTNLTQGSARSVLGVTGNATADVASIQGTASQVLRVNAANTALAFQSSAALTRVDDTNVTLTLGGTPSTALLDATSLTLGWTGTLAVARGGSGAGTLTGLLQGNGTSAFTAVTNSSTVGQVLRVTGASAYAWGAVDLTDTDAVTGTLPVARGGTGAATLTGLLQGNGTSAVTVITNSSTVGQVLRVTGASTYAWGALDLADVDAITGDLPDGNLSANVPLLNNASNTYTGLTQVLSNTGGPLFRFTDGDAAAGARNFRLRWVNTQFILASENDVGTQVETALVITVDGSSTVTQITWAGDEFQIDGAMDFNGNCDISGSLTLGTDLSVANGGTGASTLTGLLQGNGTSAFTAVTNSSTVGQVLRVTGASTYAWGALDLADVDAITGDLPDANLSANVPLINAANVFTAANRFTSALSAATPPIRVGTNAESFSIGDYVAVGIAASGAVVFEARNETDNIEATFGVATSLVQIGAVTNHPVFFYVNNTPTFQLPGTGPEIARIMHDTGYLAFFNTANTTRAGYLRFLSGVGGNMQLVNDNTTGGNVLAADGFPIRAFDDTLTTEVFRIDFSATATHTRMLVYDVDNAALERVSVGAADSGGAGFKVLRIPN